MAQNDQMNCSNEKSLRRTLLCYSTLFLVFILIIFFFFLQLFSKELNIIENNLNKTFHLNLIKYRLSLIQCGKSFVQYEYLYHMIDQSRELIQNFNRTKLLFNRDQLIVSLEFVLSKCVHARIFSLIEQERPTVLRRVISFLKREVLYIASFFY